MISKFTKLALAMAMLPLPSFAQKDASLWLTNPDRSALLQLQTPSIPFTKAAAAGLTIDVDETKKYQTIDGFGFALTGGSAQLIAHMDPAARAALLRELFTGDGDGIGVSYLRVSVGSSDMNDHVYSYDDLPQGETDPDMAKFSLEPDRADVIPVLKQILAIDPKIKILASPWSAPLWMKTTGVAKGGVLKPEYFDAYAKYFVKYILAMQAEGITIDALTVQNEPLNEKNTPSMLMLESEQADFIENHLGPAFQKAGIKTRIVLYDHNLDHPAYPLSILKDAGAAKYVDGTGFHLYGGTVDAMTQVHDAFPKKNMYFTEQMVTDRGSDAPLNIARPEARIVIGATRNWSRNVLLWNLAADPQFGPHTNDGGCPVCQGAITIDGSRVTRNIAYYTVAHASKFVPEGSVRIDSSNADALPNVAFVTPQGAKALIVANTSNSPKEFSVRYHGEIFSTSLGAGSVGTYVWR
ncbi:glycoside hydrolase family 30 protein [Edaphobacter bradus]|uniref:glycoside hydrolase family 30 protein n=1 Tax=Edaphobacter bradus TaxID=2259016 RepID=UPI0021E0883F|nr:glycoside hydrolase family 30 beta sandwich domain-containing protein [Edaphobacter bradus]